MLRWGSLVLVFGVLGGCGVRDNASGDLAEPAFDASVSIADLSPPPSVTDLEVRVVDGAIKDAGGTSDGGAHELSDLSCTAESDAELCVRLGVNCDRVTATDNCGNPRQVWCGSCTSPETCGGGGTPNVCGCTSEDDASFCKMEGSTCGTTNGLDNCGRQRTVSCGSCQHEKICFAGACGNWTSPSFETANLWVDATGNISCRVVNPTGYWKQAANGATTMHFRVQCEYGWVDAERVWTGLLFRYTTDLVSAPDLRIYGCDADHIYSGGCSYDYQLFEP
jgi:hypothetical protein